MARPSRCRRICLEPEYDRFAPCGVSDGEQIVLTVDEYEAVRLIDFEKNPDKLKENSAILKQWMDDLDKILDKI